LKDFVRLEEVNLTGNPQLGKIENKQSGIIIRLDADLQLTEEHPENEEFPPLPKKELNFFKNSDQHPEEKKNFPSFKPRTQRTVPISFSSTQERRVQEEESPPEVFDSYTYHENNYFISLFKREFREILSPYGSRETERWDRKET